MAYSEQQRAEALVTLESNGGNILQTATQLGIGEATLHRWVAESSESGEHKSNLAIATEELIPETRETFIAELKTLRNKVLRHLDNIVSDLKAREAAVTLGILIDKTELLEGNATSRTAVVGNGESVDEAITRLTIELESRPNRAEILEVASSAEGSSESESTSTAGELEQLASDGGPGIRENEVGG
jgi:transposase-like protein